MYQPVKIDVIRGRMNFMSRISRRTILKTSALAAAGLLTSRLIRAEAIEESPDRRTNPEYMQHSIKEISDEDLFAAMDLSKPQLQQVREAVAKKDCPGAYRAWGEYWESVAADRGRFLGDGDLLMTHEEATKSLEPQREPILASAEPILAHKINGWGDVTIQHGPVVNFDADYGKNGKYGFHYWGWSRRLIQAYLLTSDEKYSKGFDELFNQWYEQRNQIHGGIPELDVVYYELGLGLRCRPFLEFYCSAKPQAATHERMLKTMLGSARWLYEEEKRQYRGGNWQIMGSFGLAWIGLMLPEFADAGKWVRMGTDRIAKHTEDDFYADGCHSERVPSSYMFIGYRDPRNLAILLRDRAEYKEMSQRISAPLQRTVNWYACMLPPDGIVPAINDGSRAVFPAALVRDGEKLFGMNMRPEARTAMDPVSFSFAPSGFTAMRSNWTKDALYMLVNHGPYGGGHSHADVLDFELHAHGQACAIDSGIGYTYDDPHHGPWYKRTRAHNVLMVVGDDLDRRQAEGREVVWSALKNFDFFAATHFGYVQSKGIVNRRHIAFVKPSYWLMYDSQSGEHTLTWNLHSPTVLKSHKNGFATKSGPGIMILPSADWKPNQSKGWASVRGIRGHEGKDYAEIDWISFENSITAGAQSTLGVLLFPFATNRPDVKLQLIKQDHAAAHFSVEHLDGADHILFGEPGRTIESGDVTFSGASAVIRYRDGKPTSFCAAKTLTLKVGERSLVESGRQRDLEDNF
jgi:hypothetical protein